MPCYQVITISQEFQAEHWSLLEKAIKAMGWSLVKRGDQVVTGPPGRSFTLDLKAQKATFDERLQGDVNALKRQYSLVAVQEIGRRNGWQVKKTGGLKGYFQKAFQKAF